MAKFTITAQMKLAPPTNVSSVVQQLKNQLKGVNVPVNVTVNNQALSKLKSLQTAVNKVGKEARKSADGLEVFGKEAALAIRRFGAFNVVVGLFRRLTGAITDGTQEAIEYQRELVRIAQVADTSLRSVGSLSDEVTRLSKSFGVNSLELLKASRILKQTGLSADETQKSLEALAKSDLAPTFDDIASTAEGSIAIFRQFRKEAKDLEGILGSINAVSKNFAVESSDLITAVRRTGGAFSAAGGELNELIGLFTSVRATTRESAESIATGFRTIFTRLQRTRTINFLETLGIDLRNAQGEFVGPLEAIRQLSTALRDLPATDPRFAQITEELGGFRQISKVIPLIQQFDTAQRALNVAQAGGTSLADDAAKSQEALAIQIAKVREEFAELIRTLVNSDSFQQTVDVLLSLARALISVGEALAPVVPLIGALAIPAAAAGFSKFLRGFRGGFQPQSRNQGGLIQGFNTGGVVPGAGNRDTVPAMLTPGEFVIRKRAVQAIGVDNLQGMNRGGEFRPNLTTRSRTLGDVGRRKQFRTQRIDFLRARVEAGLATPAEIEELRNLEARQNQAQASRTARYSRRLGFTNFNLGGAVNDLSVADRRQLLAERANAAGVDFSIRGATSKTANLTLAGVIEEFANNPKTKRSRFTAGNPPAFPKSALNAILGDPKDINDGKFDRSLGKATSSGVVPTAPALANESLDESRSRSGKTDIKLPGVSLIVTQPNEKRKGALAAGLPALQKRDGKAFSVVENFINSRKGDEAKALRQASSLSVIATKPNVVTLKPNLRGELSKATTDAVLDASRRVATKALTATPPGLGDPNDILNKDDFLETSAKNSIAGSVFEGVVESIGAGVKAGEKQATIDFPKGIQDKKRAELLFDNVDKIVGVPVEAKFQRTAEQDASVIGKFIKLNPNSLFLNQGGGVPSAQDRVPAMLTPGEFVFKKEAVDRIGVNNLRKMNNVQGFNKGGFVGYQRGGVVGGGGGFDITSLFLLSSVVGGLTEQMFNFQGPLQKVQQAFTGLAIQIPLFTGLIQNALSPTGGLSNVPGTAASRAKREQAEIVRLRRENRISSQSERLLQAQSVQRGAIARQSGDVIGEQLARTTFNSSRQQRRDFLLQERARRQEVSRNVQRSETFGNRAAIGGAVALTVGNAISDLGLEEAVRPGGNRGLGTTGVRAGGALAGAGTGAAIGALFGPVGIAVGAAAGAAIGAAASWNKAREAIERVDFASTVNELNDALKNAAEGAPLGSNIGNIRSGIEGLQNRFATATSSEELQELTGAIKQNRLGFTNFLDQVARTSRTFGQFEATVGKDTIATFSEITGLPLDELNKKYREQIESQTRLIQINNNAAAARDNFNATISALVDVNNAFKDAAFAANKVSIGFNNAANAATGGALSGLPNFGELIGRGGKVLDTQQFERALEPLRTLGGDPGNVLANQAQLGQALGSAVPDILRNLRSQDPLGQGNQFGPAFRGAIQGITGGAPDSKFIEDILVARVEEIIGSEGKDEKIIDAINKDLIGTTEQILSGLEDIFTNVGEATQVITSQVNQIVELGNKRRVAEQKVVEESLKFLDIMQDAARFEEENNRGAVDFNRLRQLDTLRRDAIGPSAGLGPAQLGVRIERATSELDALNEQFKEGRGNLADIDNRRQQQASVIAEATNQLRFLADASSRTAIAIEELQQLRRDREAIAGVAQDVAFGDAGSVDALGRAVAGIATLTENTLNLSQISSGDRQGVVGLAQRLGDTRLAAFGLNEKGEVASGTEFLARESAEELIRIGVPEAIAREIANASATSAEVKLLNEIRDTNKEAAKAQLELRNIAAAQEGQIVQEIANQTTVFRDSINNLLVLSERNRLQRGIDTLQGTEASNTQTVALSQELARFFEEGGLGLQGGINQSQLDTILGQRENLVALSDIGKDITQIADLRRQFDFESDKVINLSEVRQIIRDTLRTGVVSETDRNRLNEALTSITGQNVTRDNAVSSARALNVVYDVLKNSELTAKEDGQSLVDEITSKGIILPTREDFEPFLKSLSNLEERGLQGLQGSITTTTVELDKLNRALQDLNTGGAAALGLNRSNTGGIVPGTGSFDSVPSLLTPGEFVIRKSAVEKLGMPFLQKLNQTGRVGFQEGGAVGGGGTLTIDGASLSALTNVMNVFAGASNNLTSALDNFPREVQHTFTGTLEVVHNGAAVFESLGDRFGELVKSEVQAGLNRLIEEKFPEVGPLD